MCALPEWLQWTSAAAGWAAFIWLAVRLAGFNRLSDDDDLEAKLRAHGSAINNLTTPLEPARNIFAGAPLDTTAKWNAEDATDRSARPCDMERTR